MFFMIWLIHDLIEILNVDSVVAHDLSDLFSAHLLSIVVVAHDLSVLVNAHLFDSVKVYSICFLFAVAGMCNI